MTKLIAVMTAGLFAAGTMFSQSGECVKQFDRCKASLASLNLTADQTTKMNHLLIQYRVS